ncbi:hypothetical protein C0Q70_04991 [Pomacea canaliculata]|uniref:Uncharacterized protein n=1 Tax=Pomacea canaliculata TaxID=400727 RepID=A0A2T7PJW7_POMCA|nr:hypothetical protein C0Q70_04991 [Pomacea canaliculata]
MQPPIHERQAAKASTRGEVKEEGHVNMPRGLSTCSLLLLSCVCALVIYTSAQEHYLSYDNATGFLHFRCPLDSDLKNNKLIVSTFGRYNQRTTSGQVSRIANWYNNSATKSDNTGKVVLTTRQYGLKGYLTDVRCEDSLTYYCSYHFSESNGRISTRLDNFTFSFEGSCPSTTTEKFDEGPKAGASSKEKPLLIENQSNLTVILATVIPVSVLTLMVILAMIVLRRHTKQVPPILLFPEGPPPSEYSFSAVAGRGLPPLPQVQSNDYHFSATIDKSSEPPPPLPPSYQHVESADQSVYVSMSAIPGSCDTSSTSCSSARMSETGRLWEDSDDQGMRTERSESTYSNKEAIERAKMLAQAKAKNYNTCFNYLDLLPLEVDKE